MIGELGDSCDRKSTNGIVDQWDRRMVKDDLPPKLVDVFELSVCLSFGLLIGSLCSGSLGDLVGDCIQDTKYRVFRSHPYERDPRVQEHVPLCVPADCFSNFARLFLARFLSLRRRATPRNRML